MYHLQGRRSRCQPWESLSRWLSSWGEERGERGIMEGAAAARWLCISELMGHFLAPLGNSRERRVTHSLGMVCWGKEEGRCSGPGNGCPVTWTYEHALQCSDGADHRRTDLGQVGTHYSSSGEELSLSPAGSHPTPFLTPPRT